MSLTDTRRFYALVRDSGSDGFHSHDARRRGVTGNPSQRAKDIVSKGFAMWTAREARNGRPGSLYWLDGNQPEHAVPVRPNRAPKRVCACGCGTSLEGARSDAPWASDSCRKRAERPASPDKARNRDPLSITPAPEDTQEPVAVFRDGDHFTEAPVGTRLCRRCDGTGQDGSESCAACFGTGVISLMRVNSYVEEREAA